MSSEGLTSLRLIDYSDRELLHRVNDLADDEGWVTAQQVAEAINLTHESPARCVGARFNWLKRYGAMHRDGQKWRMTTIGQSLAFGNLNTVHAAALDSLPDDRMLALVRAVSNRYRAADGVTATLMGREWKYGVAQRS
jgi:hypothetical protein